MLQLSHSVHHGSPKQNEFVHPESVAPHACGRMTQQKFSIVIG
jgi:hypothetical protein